MVQTRSSNPIFIAEYLFSFLCHGKKRGHDSSLSNHSCFFNSEMDPNTKWKLNTTIFEFRRQATINIKLWLMPKEVEDDAQLMEETNSGKNSFIVNGTVTQKNFN